MRMIIMSGTEISNRTIGSQSKAHPQDIAYTPVFAAEKVISDAVVMF
jgi:hypothetical protein